MKKLLGLTLLELTVAMVITTVVLGGLLALSANFQSTQNSASQLRYVSGVTQALISRIIKDASEAVGDSLPLPVGSPGIYLVGTPGLAAQEFCIHKVLPAAAPGAPPTPEDKWVCYRQIGNEIRVCDKAYTPTGAFPSLRGADVACTGSFVASVPPGTLISSRGMPPVKNPSFDTTTNTFTISITNLPSADLPQDNNSNPPYTAQGSVSPAGYSLEPGGVRVNNGANF